MIVRVQRPLLGSPTTKDPDIQVTDKAFRHPVIIDRATLPAWLTDALAYSPKVFASAVWHHEPPPGRWEFKNLEPWQSW